MRGEGQPVVVAKAQRRGGVELPPAVEADAGEIGERLRVVALVSFGDEQARGPAGGSGGEAACLDEQDAAETGRVAGRRGGDAEHAAADDQDVGVCGDARWVAR